MISKREPTPPEEKSQQFKYWQRTESCNIPQPCAGVLLQPLRRETKRVGLDLNWSSYYTPTFA